jgi:hypothetical protein
MAFFSWSNWLRSLVRPRVKPIRRRRYALTLEPLETRMAPATYIWSGAGTTNKNLSELLAHLIHG